jgi:hypothetical protein
MDSRGFCPPASPTPGRRSFEALGAGCVARRSRSRVHSVRRRLSAKTSSTSSRAARLDADGLDPLGKVGNVDGPGLSLGEIEPELLELMLRRALSALQPIDRPLRGLHRLVALIDGHELVFQEAALLVGGGALEAEAGLLSGSLQLAELVG